jgi:hypothetical protein
LSFEGKHHILSFAPAAKSSAIWLDQNSIYEVLMANQPNKLNLLNLFRSVSGSLTTQRENLNNADTYNHDHGDNMIDVFNVISQAMQAKQNADPADQLEYASQLLRQRKSGSAQVYAQGLSQASKQFQGQKQVTPENAINLIQSLIGSGQASTAQPQAGMGDLLGSLLGAGSTAPQQPRSGAGDLLGMLLGGTDNAQAQPQNQPASTGPDVNSLLDAGMAFMNTKSQGGSNAQAMINAVISSSAMGDSQHRSQSGALVVNSLLQAIAEMSGKK